MKRKTACSKITRIWRKKWRDLPPVNTSPMETCCSVIKADMSGLSMTPLTAPAVSSTSASPNSWTPLWSKLTCNPPSSASKSKAKSRSWSSRMRSLLRKVQCSGLRRPGSCPLPVLRLTFLWLKQGEWDWSRDRSCWTRILNSKNSKWSKKPQMKRRGRQARTSRWKKSDRWRRWVKIKKTKTKTRWWFKSTKRTRRLWRRTRLNLIMTSTMCQILSDCIKILIITFLKSIFQN